MSDTRRKHIRKRKQENKIRRFCRWKHITVEEYWQMKLAKKFGFGIDDYEKMMNSIRELADQFSEMARNLAYGLGSALEQLGKNLKEMGGGEDENNIH